MRRCVWLHIRLPEQCQPYKPKSKSPCGEGAAVVLSLSLALSFSLDARAAALFLPRWHYRRHSLAVSLRVLLRCPRHSTHCQLLLPHFLRCVVALLHRLIVALAMSPSTNRRFRLIVVRRSSLPRCCFALSLLRCFVVSLLHLVGWSASQRPQEATE